MVISNFCWGNTSSMIDVVLFGGWEQQENKNKKNPKTPEGLQKFLGKTEEENQTEGKSLLSRFTTLLQFGFLILFIFFIFTLLQQKLKITPISVCIK